MRLSLRDGIDGDLSYLRELEAVDYTRNKLLERIRAEVDVHWWLVNELDFVESLISEPNNLDAVIDSSIRRAVSQAQSSGAPNLPEVFATCFGWTLFGDPKKKAQK